MNRSLRARGRSHFLFTGMFLLVAAPLFATTLTVKSTADAGGTCPGNSCTLRQAIATSAADDTINFALPANSVITLTGGELLINKNLTILGPGANVLTVQRSAAGGTPAFRIFNISPSSVIAVIFGMTIANGNTTVSGGAILNGGTLYLTNCTISGNRARNGGGLFNNSVLVATNCAVCANTVSDNALAGSGGGIFTNGGTVYVSNSTVSGNTAIGPGGNSDSGGGIFSNFGTVNLANSTIAGNSGDLGGGIRNLSGTLNSKNSIVALNTSPSGPDCNGPLTSQGYNFIGNNSGATISATTGDQIGTAGSPKDPMLGPLQNNGGPTQTRALLPSSTAIESGLLASGFVTDQRGLPRPVDSPTIVNAVGGDGSDIGAYEVQSEFLAGCNAINHVVANNNDSGVGSLRDVIVNVCNGSTITFASNVRGAINLTSDQLLLNKSLTINGPGPNLLSVQRSSVLGTPEFRIFDVVSSVVVNISGLTIANGKTRSDATGVNLNGNGIRNIGTLTLTNVSVTGNAGNFSGNTSVISRGAISNISANLTVTNSTISGNLAGIGGGIYSLGGATPATLTVTNSTISSNYASSDGGGIYAVTCPFAISNSTVSGNGSGGTGGGIYGNNGPVTLNNVTVSGNSAATGGGIESDVQCTLTLLNSTIAGNSAMGNPGDGGGGLSYYNSNIYLRNTIIALNTSTLGPDIQTGALSILTSQGFNLIGNNTDASFVPTTGDQVGTAASPINPLLGPLRDNGGSTQTQAPLDGSPAIDQGNSNGPATDQRGYIRPIDLPGVANVSGGDGSDIGAFELGAQPIRITSITRPDATHILLQGIGVPNAAHTLQVSADLSPNSFGLLGSFTTDAIGVWQYTDSIPANQTRRFYQATFP